ncbi:MAG: penicillin-binding protein activator LpoB [Thiotrichaceae bacterium]|nr:penicillin-binding protein activator LpoB [Thiotrichaceae bacterium]
MSACTNKVAYQGATDVETTTIDFGSTDLQQIATKMVDSLLTFPPIVQVTDERRAVMFVDKIKNKTTEHIDTESIIDTISNRILRSGKFRFVDMNKVNKVNKVKEVSDQLKFQNKSGMVNRNTASQVGRQIGAEYMMYGSLSSLVKQTKDVKDVYYKFMLKVMHLESGLIEWSDEKEIRKTREKSLFGR